MKKFLLLTVFSLLFTPLFSQTKSQANLEIYRGRSIQEAQSHKSKNIDLFQQKNVLFYEDFQNVPVGSIPSGWEIQGENGSWSVSNSSYAGGQSPEMLLNWTPQFVGLSRLVTHSFSTTSNEMLRMKQKHYLNNYDVSGNTLAIQVSFDGGTWVNIWDKELTESFDPEDLEFYIDVPTGASSMRIGWEFEGDVYDINNYNFDNVVVEPVEDNDLAAISISGNPIPKVGELANYTITIHNSGLITQNNYSVKLMKEGGVELASVGGNSINFNETKAINLSWTPQPADEGELKIYGEVVFANDQDASNNQTNLLSLHVAPEGTIAIPVGDEDTNLKTRVPFDFYYKNSLTQTLYYAHEIGITKGAITGIAYQNSFLTDQLDKEVRVWIAETHLNDLGNGWIPFDQFTLVYEGALDFPSGDNSIFIPFDNPYLYGGRNLVVYVNRVWEDNYSSEMDMFYISVQEGSERLLYIAADGSDPLPPDNPDNPELYDFYPNITFLAITDGFAEIIGSVVQQGSGDPLEGVRVQVSNTNSKTHSDPNGEFNFVLFPGTYNFSFDKHGYESKVISNIALNEGAVDTHSLSNVSLSQLSQYKVSGKVKGNDNLTLSDATVTLEGYDIFNTTTDHNGEFTIEGVYEGTYTLTISKKHYDDYVIENLVVNQNKNLGILQLAETLVVPSGLAVDIQDGGNVLLSWEEELDEFRYDNGTFYSAIGFADGDVNTVMGAVHRHNAILKEVSWILAGDTEHNTVKVWILGLDSEGYPDDSNVLYSQDDVPIVDMQWNTLKLPYDIPAPNGFFMAIGRDGNLGLAIDTGSDDEWPFQHNANFAGYVGGNYFFPVEDQGYPYNFFIRAQGIDNGPLRYDTKNEVKQNSSTTNNLDIIKSEINPLAQPLEIPTTRAFSSFNVFLNNMQTPVATGVQDYEYLFTNLSEGNYTAGVQSVYTTGVSEIATLDFTIDYGVPITINISTNSGTSPQGAKVHLSNDKYDLMGVANAQGKVEFPVVYRGVYDLSVSLTGHTTHFQDGINIQSTQNIDVQLIESIITPSALSVDILEEGNVLFSWITDEYEFRYDSGNVDSSVGIEEGDMNLVFGAAHRNNAELTSVSWLLDNTFGDHPIVKVWILGLNEAGQPDATNVLYSKDDVVNVDMEWNTFELPYRVSAPNGFFIGLSTVGVMGMAVDSGLDEDWPFQFNTNYIGFADGNVFLPFEEVGIASNLFIRATGINFGELRTTPSTNLNITKAPSFELIKIENNSLTLSSLSSSTRAYLGCSVYLDNMVTPVATGIQDDQYLFTNLAEGNYTAGVKSVYTSGESELVTLDFTIDYGVHINVNITTNSSDGPQGALVTLKNEEYEHSGLADAQGKVEFPVVYRGLYNLTVSLENHDLYQLEDINIQDAIDFDVNLNKIIHLAPFGLMAQQLTTDVNVRLSWDNFLGFKDDFESYDDFIIEEIGDFILYDGDGSTTHTLGGGITYPNSQYMGAYMIFNPSQTTPAITNADIAPYSGNKFLASFAAVNGPNNDWLITPKIEAQDGMKLSFRAKTYINYGVEEFRVAVSTTDTNPESFEFIADITPAPLANWGEFEYDLSSYASQDIYIAVVCVSNDVFLFMLDDLEISVNTDSGNDVLAVLESNRAHSSSRPLTTSFLGFKVYLDDELVSGETPIMDTEIFFDGLNVNQSYVAGVQSVYTNGESDIQLLPFTPSTQYTVQGRIKDSEGYLSGVEVKLGNRIISTSTDGSFTFMDVLGGTYSLLIEHEGYEPYSTVVSTESVTIDVIDLGDITLAHVAPDTYTVKGKVKDAEGYLANINVQLDNLVATTDAGGLFTFNNVEEGNYNLTIDVEGYGLHTQAVSTTQAVDGVVNLGDITLIAILPDTYTVKGKVKDADGYLANINVQLDNLVATTDAGGLFTFNNVEEGNYNLTIDVEGYGLHTQAVSTTQAVDGVVNLGDITLIAILPDTYTVKGKVKDADGYLANITVQLDGAVATTDAGGLFTFNNVEEGNYNLTIDVEGYELHSQAVSTTQAVDGVVNLGDITLIAILPDTYTVKGKVKDADGYLANITVQLDGTVATTDAGGLFTFSNVEEGNYTLTIDVEGYELHTQAVSTTEAVNNVVDLGDIVLIATDVNQILFTDITVYPNPFNHTLNISNAHLVSRVIITNILGQNILDVNLENSSDINTEVLNTGVYLITLQGYNNEVVVRRVVKR